MISYVVTLFLTLFDFIAWDLLGFTTIEVVDSVSNFIYYLEHLGL